MGHADQKPTQVRLERIHRDIASCKRLMSMLTDKRTATYREARKKLQELEWKREDILNGMVH